jgi:hypothetical protein
VRRGAALAVAALAAAATFAASSARAADDDPQIAEARRFFDAGKQAYEAGQYALAATAFEEAFRLAPRPTVAFSMAQAYRRQFFVDRDAAKLKRALDLYKQYIVDVPEGGRRDDAVQYIAELEPMLVRIEDEQRQKGLGPVKSIEAAPGATQLMISSRTKGASARIDAAAAHEVPVIREVAPGNHRIRVEAPGYFTDEVDGVAVAGRLVVVEVTLREQPARLSLVAPTGAEVAIDGRPVAELPLARPLEIVAGTHLVTITQRGRYAFTRELRLARGQELTVEASLERTRQRTASWWVLGAAGAAFVAGGVEATFAFVHQGRAQDVLDRRAGRPITQAELDSYNHERDARDRDVTAAAVLFGSAALVGATGALLYFIDTPSLPAPGRIAPVEPIAPPDPGLTLAPTSGPGGMMGLALTGRF